jgi:hypothetical protein
MTTTGTSRSIPSVEVRPGDPPVERFVAHTASDESLPGDSRRGRRSVYRAYARRLPLSETARSGFAPGSVGTSDGASRRFGGSTPEAIEPPQCPLPCLGCSELRVCLLATAGPVLALT